jgi:hypothetical protein
MINASVSFVWSYTPAPANAVSVATFGAKGDGITDDATALIAAVNSISDGTNLSFEPGKTYAIGRAIFAKDQYNPNLAANFNIYGQDAKIKALGTFKRIVGNVSGGPLIIWRCSNFTISDLIIDGNRTERFANGTTAGQDWTNHNFYLLSCKNFKITKVRSINSCGDGFFLDSWGAGAGKPSTHLDINNRNENGVFMECSADNSDRNGMSCDFAWNIQIIGGYYSNSHGDPPESGIDVEPDGDMASPAIQNILIKGVSFAGSNEQGLILPSVAGSHNVTVDGCYFNENRCSGLFINIPDVTVKNCVFYGRSVYGCGSNGEGVLAISFLATNCVVTGNTIANIKNGGCCILVQNSTAKVANNKIYDFTVTAINPASYNAGNDIQQGKIIADPGVPDPNVISINSSPSISVPTGGKFGYKVKYLNLTKTPTVSISWLKKPTWVTTQIDSAFCTTVAPAIPGKDSMKVVVSAGTSSDTLTVIINISYYKILEAESGTLVAPMVIVADPAASSGNCISAPGGINTITKNIEASYTVTDMPAGTYYVWLKISIPAGNLTNNFGTFIGFGASLNPTTSLKPNVENSYKWVRNQTNFTLAAGTNTFIMGHGLAGAKIDQIVLTTSWEAVLPANYISIQEKQTKGQKMSLNATNLIVKPLSGGKINFVVNGIGVGNFAMDVFNVAGSRVWSCQQKGDAASEHQVIWDGTDSQLKPVRSGVYLARIQANNTSKQTSVFLQR